MTATYFKPWRRKLGVLTLGLGCVFMGEWIRGQSIADILFLPPRKQITDSAVTAVADSITFQKNVIIFERYHDVFTEPRYKWAVDAGPQYVKWKTSGFQSDFFGDADLKWHWQWGGFGYCEPHAQATKDMRTTYLLIPYWSITIPLTLISLWLLLLSKPRKSNQKKITEPTANDWTRIDVA